MKVQKKFFLFFIFFAFCSFSKTIYVSTNGDNSAGNGTIEMPYKTIYFALNQANVGDEIMLRGAPYLSNNKYCRG